MPRGMARGYLQCRASKARRCQWDVVAIYHACWRTSHVGAKYVRRGPHIRLAVGAHPPHSPPLYLPLFTLPGYLEAGAINRRCCRALLKITRRRLTLLQSFGATPMHCRRHPFPPLRLCSHRRLSHQLGSPPVDCMLIILIYV